MGVKNLKKYAKHLAFALALALGLSLFTGNICAVSRHTGVLDGIFPNEHYAPQDGARGGDPADGMPEDNGNDRFGEDAGREDRAADGSEGGTATATEDDGVSVWVAVLVLSLAATAIVIAVIYLLPRRKEKKE